MEFDQIMLLVAARKRIGSGTARQIREAAGLTQADIAKLIGVGASAMSRLEAGTRAPRPETAIKWAAVLAKLERANRRSASAA